MMRSHRAAFFAAFLLLLTIGAPLAAQDAPTADPAVPVDPAAPIELTPTPAPLPTMGARPAAASSVTDSNTRLDVLFRVLPQGQARLVNVRGSNDGGSPVSSARARWLDRFVDFYDAGAQGFFALVSASMEQTARNGYPLEVYVTYADGTRATLTTALEITLGSFIRQEIALSGDRAYLLDIETERSELARLESLFAQVTETRHWDSSGFGLPIESTLTSPFGAFRTFNGALSTRHTGWDLRTGADRPVVATAAGRVVFADVLPIRGNHIVIDHGFGVFSGYSHLSVMNVQFGEDVAKGQIVGMVGNTGRTSGVHFHWEMTVNGDWIDGARFVELWQP